MSDLKGAGFMLNISEIINKEYSSGEKEKFIELIKVIVNLSNKAHLQGPLSLEEDWPLLHPFLLRKGIEIIVEGCYVRELSFILDNYIQAKKYSEAELLERLIIREGVLFIQNGGKGKILFEKILSMLGEDFFQDFDYSIFDEKVFVEEKPKYNHPISKELNVFENKIMSINDFENMDKLVMKVGYFNMAYALKGSSSKVQSHVKNLISVKFIVHEIDNTLKLIGPCRLQDVTDAQNFILRSL